jgi:hypothetical protein
MAKLVISTKRNLIDQANTRVVIVTSIAAFVFIFCAVATKTLVSQASYQNRVISAKKTAVKQLKADIEAVGDLKKSYNAFTSTSTNVLGGSSVGTGPQDGNNAKIVLDALPSAYDFPALATSLEKLTVSQNLKINNISGTDDQVAQAENQTSSSPKPVEMPFQVSVAGPYANIQGLVTVFGQSIRPMKIQTIDISGNQENLTLSVNALTYYQPGKSLNINTKVVK